jgi:hypothetical protein
MRDQRNAQLALELSGHREEVLVGNVFVIHQILPILPTLRIEPAVELHVTSGTLLQKLVANG